MEVSNLQYVVMFCCTKKKHQIKRLCWPLFVKKSICKDFQLCFFFYINFLYTRREKQLKYILITVFINVSSVGVTTWRSLRVLYHMFNINWINKLFKQENKAAEHSLKLERWRGPPHINKVKHSKRSVCLFSHENEESVCFVCLVSEDLSLHRAPLRSATLWLVSRLTDNQPAK